jgi:ABC-type Fe3+-hydroxamate transport system substrate-binding protein
MEFTDQMGQRILLAQKPSKIVSLVPSQTELLLDLGLENELVGITKFCIHPQEKVKKITKIGGTKQFRFEVIHQLNPDLIIGNKEENYEEGIKELQKHYPVWMSDIETLEDALEMIVQVGEITQTTTKARQIALEIEKGFQRLPKIGEGLRVAYFIWRKPWMVAAKNTFIHHILEKLGFQNVFEHLSRYPEIQLEQISKKDLDFIFLSSEPYPFAQKHLEELTTQFPHTKIRLVDGEMFSWYGSRLLKSVAYFEQFHRILA